MDSLGERLARDAARVDELIKEASDLEERARWMRAEANEIERLMELARRAHG